MKNTVIDNIEQCTAIIGIVGLGYVGLPLLRFVEEGFLVIGFDINEEKCRALQAGRSYIAHIGDDKVCAAHNNGRTRKAATNIARSAEPAQLSRAYPRHGRSHGTGGREPGSGAGHIMLLVVNEQAHKAR